MDLLPPRVRGPRSRAATPATAAAVLAHVAHKHAFFSPEPPVKNSARELTPPDAAPHDSSACADSVTNSDIHAGGISPTKCAGGDGVPIVFTHAANSGPLGLRIAKPCSEDVALVLEADPDGAAARAGVSPGDELQSIDGNLVVTLPESELQCLILEVSSRSDHVAKFTFFRKSAATGEQ